MGVDQSKNWFRADMKNFLRVKIINKGDGLQAQSRESQSLTFKNRLDICWGIYI